MVQSVRAHGLAASGTAGIARAHARFESAAAQTAQRSLARPETVSISARGRELAGQQGRGNDDLAGALTEMSMAEHQQAGSVAVVRAADEMLGELLRLADDGRE